MKKIRLLLLSLPIVALAAVAARAGGVDPGPYTGSPELEKLKKLEGHWEGMSNDMSPDKQPHLITTDYHVTSGGTAVVETLFAGTPHEMVSIYHDEDGKLAMTHYCLMRNQPHMTLQKSSADTVTLAVGKNGGVDPKSMHMHEVALKQPSDDQLVETWTSYSEGKAQTPTVFRFKRTGPED